MLKKLHKWINQWETTIGRQRLLSGPTHAQIEPTNRCNQDCGMCSRLEMLKEVREGDMSLEQFKRILDQLPHLIDIQINGLGEPLMNPLTPTFIREATQRGIKVAMNTNAAFITETKAEELLDSGLQILKISMDGADEDLYRKIRSAPLKPALKGLQRIIQARQKRPNCQTSIHFNTVIQKDNREHLFPIVQLASEYKIDRLRFKVVGMFDLWDPKDLGVSLQELPLICRKLQSQITKNHLNVSHNLQDLVDHPERLFRRHALHPCYSPFTEIYVQCYGGIRLCCEFYDVKSDVGNLFETDFKKIWNGPQMQEIRRRYWSGDTFFANCAGCNRFYPNEVKYQKIRSLRRPFEIFLSKSLPKISLDNSH